MPPSGRKRRENIHLSQKRTCGRIDGGAGVYGGCYAYEEPSRNFGDGYCHLGFKCKNGKPLEPCLKPTTISQYMYARKIIGKS
jgi:hypothetical protein